MDILVPILEREGIKLSLEAHPEDWLEENAPAVDIIKTINFQFTIIFYCTHTNSLIKLSNLAIAHKLIYS